MKDERNRLGKGFAVAIVAHVIFALLLGVFGFSFNSNRPPEILEVSLVAGGGAPEEPQEEIDNTQNVSDMVKEIEKGLNIANQKGLAIMIGHIWSANTLPNLLMELYPVLVKKGYKFTTVSNSGGLITP